MSRNSDTLRTVVRIALPIVVIALGAWGAYEIYEARVKPEKSVRVAPPPVIEVEALQPTSVTLDVVANGTVRPHVETTLVSEIEGRVLEVSPSLEAGGFFEEGDVLVRIEARDYELALVQVTGELADAEYALSLEKAEAEAAIEEWNELSDEPAPDLVRRVPQLAAARARVEAVKARREAAERDLERTRVRSPYAGRVRSKRVGVGQFVARGTELAQVYAVDYAEVRLPLRDRDVGFVDLPIDYRNASDSGNGPAVTIRGDFGGVSHEWSGRIVRTEGELGDRSRMLYAIARVDDPYGRSNKDSDRPPLLVGMFVEATIAGRVADSVFVVPRTAMRGEDTVLVVAEGDTLHARTVEVVRTEDDRVFVSAGLEPGERVCVTRLEIFSEGMRVRIAAPKDDQR